MGAPRVVIVDDHTLLNEAFRRLLEPECEVVGVVTDGRAIVPKAIALRPDVVVLDIGMPLLNGLDAGRQLKQLMPAVRLIFVTMNEDPDLAREALGLGASGFLLKTSTARELPEAIRTAMRGDTYVTSRASQRMVESFIQEGDRSAGSELTSRQREVLQLLAIPVAVLELAERHALRERQAFRHAMDRQARTTAL